MGDGLPKWMLDAKTPTEAEVTSVLRTPLENPRLGVDVPADAEGTPRHRLVAIGGSLTHGYPAIIAHEMGWYGHFRQPSYFGEGGLPLNLALFGRILL
jgi:hypothetical protein